MTWGSTQMEIRDFERDNQQFKAEAAELFAESFPCSYQDSAAEEVRSCLAEGKIALMAVEDGHLMGFVGAVAHYGVTGWELHPLAVKQAYQQQGIGTRLVQALEQEVAARGGITLYLGTDDEFDQTSLSNTDLYQDTYAKIEHVRNLHHHPFEFYQKMGYKIVGVIPDANGIGKPDILMAKRISDQTK